mgnify:CR=1 FL=1
MGHSIKAGYLFFVKRIPKIQFYQIPGQCIFQSLMYFGNSHSSGFLFFRKTSTISIIFFSKLYLMRSHFLANSKVIYNQKINPARHDLMSCLTVKVKVGSIYFLSQKRPQK